MPRTRSVASPPPRRSGKSDRPRSVSRLAHRAKKPVKKVHAEELESLEPIVVQEEQHEVSHDPKRELIRAHSVARAERHQSSLGAGGMIAVVVTCAIIFAGWWALPDFFEKPAPLVPAPLTTPSSTASLVPEAATSSTTNTPTSTERRLLLPLTPPTSTNSPR